MRANASLRMTSNYPVIPHRKRFMESEGTRASDIFRTVASWDPQNPGRGSSALGSHMTLAGGADIARRGKYCTWRCLANKKLRPILPLLCLSEPVQWHRVEIIFARLNPFGALNE